MLFLMLWLFIAGACAAIGAKMAASRHRDSGTWALICFLCGFLGIVVLAVLGTGTGTTGAAVYDIRRWEALKDVDPDIAAAATKALAVSPDCEHQLAEKYLALNDKKYLRPLLKKVLEEFKETDAEAIEADAVELARLELELSAFRRS